MEIILDIYMTTSAITMIVNLLFMICSRNNPSIDAKNILTKKYIKDFTTRTDNYYMFIPVWNLIIATLQVYYYFVSCENLEKFLIWLDE